MFDSLDSTPHPTGHHHDPSDETIVATLKLEPSKTQMVWTEQWWRCDRRACSCNCDQMEARNDAQRQTLTKLKMRTVVTHPRKTQSMRNPFQQNYQCSSQAMMVQISRSHAAGWCLGVLCVAWEALPHDVVSFSQQPSFCFAFGAKPKRPLGASARQISDGGPALTINSKYTVDPDPQHHCSKSSQKDNLLLVE